MSQTRRHEDDGPEPGVVPKGEQPGGSTDAGRDADNATTHAVGMTAGGGAGALAGGILGSIAGPGGMIVGAGLGAVAGIFAGRGVTEAIVNTDEEDRHWHATYHARPYVKQGSAYEQYRPAYRYGWENAAAHVPEGRTFETLEPEMERHWPRLRSAGGGGEMDWMTARPAALDAWQRVEGRIKRREHDAGRMV
jgi:hypothetical protein